jgi:hypothetical protein
MFLFASYSSTTRTLLWVTGLGGSIAFLLAVALARGFPNGWLRWGGVVVALTLGVTAAVRLIGQVSNKDTSSVALLIWLAGAALGLILVVIGAIQFLALRGPR